MLMIFWFFWMIGIISTAVLLIITERRVDKFCDENCLQYEDICFEQLDTKTQVLLCMRAVIWNAIVVGIAISQFSGLFYDETFLARMVISTLEIVMLYFWGIIYLQIKLCNDKKIHILIVIIFMLSIAIWTTLISNYYQRNVEEVTQKVIEQIERRELVDICDIPVTGEKRGTSERKTDIGDWLPYKYIDRYDKIQEDVAPASCISSRQKELMEPAYVEIISYHYYKEYTDYYTGQSWIMSEHSWKEYIFYLPNNLSIVKK